MRIGWSVKLAVTVLVAVAAFQAIWATRAWADVPDEPFIEFSVSPTTIRLGECAENYGKLRVGDIRSTDGRLYLEWYLWD